MVWAFHARAVAYAKKGDHQRAIENYDEAIRLKPNYAAAFSNRGLAYERKGDRGPAAMDFAIAALLRAK